MVYVGFPTFQDISLPRKVEASHRTFWKDIGIVFRYHAGLRLGRLKLSVNRRPWLRRAFLSLIRMARDFQSIDITTSNHYSKPFLWNAVMLLAPPTPTVRISDESYNKSTQDAELSPALKSKNHFVCCEWLADMSVIKGMCKRTSKRRKIQENKKVLDEYIWNLLEKEKLLPRLTRRLRINRSS